MSNPSIRKLRHSEEVILSKAKKDTIHFKNFEIQIYFWGKPDDKVCFLVHGWEGQAGNFGKLIDILLRKEYYVVAFDGPSHGHSSKGPTSMFELSGLVSSLVSKFKPTVILSHSFGSVTTIMALQQNPEIMVNQWLAVTTPNNFKDRLNDIKLLLGISDKTMNTVINKIETDTGMSIETMNMRNYGQKIDNVKQVIIIHSKNDNILPIQYARKASQHISQSELIELEGLGHYTILWSDQLQQIIKSKID